MAPRPYQRAESVISEDEKEIGVVVVDVGPRATHLWIYEAGWLRVADVIASGIDHRGASAGRLAQELLAAVLEWSRCTFPFRLGLMRERSMPVRHSRASGTTPSATSTPTREDQLVRMFERVRAALHAWGEVMDHLLPAKG